MSPPTCRRAGDRWSGSESVDRRIARPGFGSTSPLAAWPLAALSRQFCLGRLELVAIRGELFVGQRDHVTGPQFLVTSR